MDKLLFFAKFLLVIAIILLCLTLFFGCLAILGGLLKFFCNLYAYLSQLLKPEENKVVTKNNNSYKKPLYFSPSEHNIQKINESASSEVSPPGTYWSVTHSELEKQKTPNDADVIKNKELNEYINSTYNLQREDEERIQFENNYFAINDMEYIGEI